MATISRGMSRLCLPKDLARVCDWQSHSKPRLGPAENRA